MKGLIAALGVLITVGVVVVCAVVELLIKLAPLLVLAAGIWIAIKVWRSRRKRRENRGHIVTPWEWEHPAQGPTASAQRLWRQRSRLRPRLRWQLQVRRLRCRR